MLLREFIMVVCRNAGRYYKVARRSDFYHDFLTSLYDNDGFPAFFNNRVACIKFYRSKLGYLPELHIRDEVKTEKYIYYYDIDSRCIRSVTIRETIMRMYNPENHFAFALKSLKYCNSVFDLFHGRTEEADVVDILRELDKVDFSKFTGEEPLDIITDPVLLPIIQKSLDSANMYGIHRRQDRIEQKRQMEKENNNG